MFRPTSITVYLMILILAFSVANALAANPKGTFSGSIQTEYPAWFKDSFLDFPEDLADAKTKGKRLMVLFYQPGCPYCNALVERNLSQKDIQEKTRKNLDVIAINMWGDKELTYVNGKQYSEKTLAEALRVQFTPTVLFFNEEGKIILRLNGYRAPKRFSIELDYVIDHKENEISARNYIKANLPHNKSNDKLHSEDFFGAPPYNLDRSKGNAKRPLAVFFEQKDCPDCDILHTKVLIDETTRQIIKQFDTIQLDMWSNTPVVTPVGEKTTAKQWAKKLNIEFAPSIVLFSQSGEEIIRSEAFFKVFHTQGIFHYVLSQEYRKQPSFQRYLSERAEQLREEGKSVDIWNFADKESH